MGTSFSRRRTSSKPSSPSGTLKRLLPKEVSQHLTNVKSSLSSSLFPFPSTKEESKQANKAWWMPFSQVSLLSGDPLQFQLLGSHLIGPKTYIETVLQGTKIQLEELRLTLLHTFASSHHAKERKFWKDGQITIFAGTDLNFRHRISLESILGSEEKGLTFATMVSTDFASGISWGFANSYRPCNKLTLFTRFTSDENSAKQIILQAVQKLNDKDMLSPICAATLGNQLEAGISWTRQFNSGTGDTLQVKALCNKEGSFSFNIKAQVGEVQ